MTLLAKLQSMNAETRAWIAGGPNRWAGFLIEDLSHWAELDVNTVEDLERYFLETAIWDLYKDVYGVRPRHMNLKAMSHVELTARLESLSAYAQQASDFVGYGSLHDV